MTQKKHVQRRKSPALAATELEPDARVDSVAGIDADDAENDLLQLLDAQDEGVSVRVTVFKLLKKPEGGFSEAQLFTAQREDLENGLWDRLRDIYGSGTYRVRLRRRLPGERETFWRQIDRAVMMRPGLPEPGATVTHIPLTPAPAAQPAATAPGDLGAAIAGALSGVLDRQAAMFAQMLDRIAPKQSGGSMKEIVETLAALDQLRGGKEAAPAQNPMEFVKMGMELVRDAAPGEKGIADVAASLIQSGVLDRIADVFAQRNAAPAAPGAPPPAPRAIPSNLPPPGPIQQQYLMELVVQVGQMAEQVPQPDIAEVADFVDFNAPPAMVRELVYNDQLFEQLQLVPIVAKHRGFFAALRENLAAGMIGPDEGASDENNDTRQPTARPGGDAGDTKANAPAGAGGQAA